MLGFNLFKKANGVDLGLELPDHMMMKNMLVDFQNGCDFTPDAAILDQYWAQNIFVYDHMMKGFSKNKHFLQEPAQHRWAGFTQSRNMVLWKKCLGRETLPFALEVEDDMKHGKSSLLGKPACINGQIYTVRPYQIRDIDKHLMNGVQYERKRVTVEVPYGRTHLYHQGKSEFHPRVSLVKAWMWVGKSDYWKDLMTVGSNFAEVKLYTANEGRENLERQYYFFNENIESN